MRLERSRLCLVVLVRHKTSAAVVEALFVLSDQVLIEVSGLEPVQAEAADQVLGEFEHLLRLTQLLHLHLTHLCCCQLITAAAEVEEVRFSGRLETLFEIVELGALDVDLQS